MTDLGRQKKSELLIGLNSSKLEPLVNLINETCSDVEDKDVLAAAMQFMLDFGIYIIKLNILIVDFIFNSVL